ncbi:MAG: DNA-formamidopyrimidine glycosylase [Anaeroplasmataceae bacterium]
MPELPEVETVRRVLLKELKGLKIVDVVINYSKMIKNDINYFKASVMGKEFKDIKRLGKALIFKLDDIYLVSHLRMEGKYFIKDPSDEILKHEHVIFTLSNGKTLRYHDTRKFGIMVIKNEEELYKTEPLNMISSEPFTITKEELFLKLKEKTIPIKTALLDQSIMSGLGNIYVDEVLFKSKINPHRKAKEVSLEECELIISNSIVILNKSIEYGGTTIRSYTSSLGVSGNYQQFLAVHTKTICPICNNSIIKDKTNGRGTYYCPVCQNK